MSLETRVETLEHELKILKNEIESTLLEIQNQVLIHYYPTLRAEENTPPTGPLPIRKVQATEQVKEKATASEDDLDEPDWSERDTADAILPKTKEISLQQIKPKPKALPPLSAKPVTSPSRHPASVEKESTLSPEATLYADVVIDQAAWPSIAKWINESVERIGKELTQNLIESAVSAESTTPGLTELLLQFVTVCDEPAPPEQVTTRDLMDVLLKLNKLLDQVASLTEPAPAEKEAADG